MTESGQARLIGRRQLLRGAGAAAVVGAAAPSLLLGRASGAVGAAATVWDVPASIDATGATDVGRQLTDWLATLIGPGTVRFRSGGTYRVNDAAVVVNAANGVIFDFNGASLRRTRVLTQAQRYVEHTPFFRLTGGSQGCTIRNLTISGFNHNGFSSNHAAVEAQADGRTNGVPYFLDSRGVARPWEPVPSDLSGWGGYCVALEFEHGIHVNDAKNLVIEDCFIAGAFGDGIYVSGAATDGVTIQRSQVWFNGRQGIALIEGRNILIDGVRIQNSRRGGVDFEPDKASQVLQHVEIRNCFVRPHLRPFPSWGGGAVSNIYIHHNEIHGNKVPLLDVRSGSSVTKHSWRFEDNVAVTTLNSPAPGISLTGVVFASVQRNQVTFRPATAMTAVGLSRSDHVAVKDNSFRGAVKVVNASPTPSNLQACGNVYADGQVDRPC